MQGREGQHGKIYRQAPGTSSPQPSGHCLSAIIVTSRRPILNDKELNGGCPQAIRLQYKAVLTYTLLANFCFTLTISALSEAQPQPPHIASINPKLTESYNRSYLLSKTNSSDIR